MISYFGGFGQGGIIGGVSGLKNVLVGGNADLSLVLGRPSRHGVQLGHYLAMANRLPDEQVAAYAKEALAGQLDGAVEPVPELNVQPDAGA
ncbi:MAG: hypothetical protein ABSD85_10545 [Acidimicrobiales bacterium]